MCVPGMRPRRSDLLSSVISFLCNLTILARTTDGSTMLVTQGELAHFERKIESIQRAASEIMHP